MEAAGCLTALSPCDHQSHFHLTTADVEMLVRADVPFHTAVLAGWSPGFRKPPLPSSPLALADQASSPLIHVGFETMWVKEDAVLCMP
jgi:hypothetical protein